jgi:hypothetical protein
MIGEALVQLDAPFGGGAHEMDAPARRLRFDAEHAVRRAGVETQPAVNALVKLGHVQCGDTRPRFFGYVVRVFHGQGFSFKFLVSIFEKGFGEILHFVQDDRSVLSF